MMLHILRKDIRRFWWEIVVTVALLALLAHTDRWRADWIPSSMEGWLNLLLPLAWAYLIAIVVQEEPLVGDRQFWVTRPYRWPQLLTAKALFVLLFIHLPALLADMAILAARGFQPLEHIPQLLWKQLLLFGALTLPAVALAALFRNLAQFMLAAVVAAAAAAFVGGTATPVMPWIPADEVRNGVTLLVIVAAAAVIVWLQFARRRTLISRTVAVSAALAAAALVTYWPATLTSTVRSALAPAHVQLSLRLAVRQEEPPRYMRSSNRITIGLPIDVSGIPRTAQFRFEPIVTEIAGPQGDHYQAEPRSAYASFQKILMEAYVYPWDQGASWLFLRLDRSVYDRIKDAKVKLSGVAAITFRRAGQTTWMPIGANQPAPGGGRCSSVMVESRYSYSPDMLKVVCESPSEIPLWTWVRLWNPETGREWNGRLGDSATSVPYPRGTWLSPLNRRQTFFQISEGPSGWEYTRWRLTRDALDNARVAVTPEPVTGYATLRYEIPDLALSHFVVKSIPQP